MWARSQQAEQKHLEFENSLNITRISEKSEYNYEVTYILVNIWIYSKGFTCACVKEVWLRRRRAVKGKEVM